MTFDFSIAVNGKLPKSLCFALTWFADPDGGNIHLVAIVFFVVLGLAPLDFVGSSPCEPTAISTEQNQTNLSYNTNTIIKMFQILPKSTSYSIPGTCIFTNTFRWCKTFIINLLYTYCTKIKKWFHSIPIISTAPFVKSV